MPYDKYIALAIIPILAIAFFVVPRSITNYGAVNSDIEVDLIKKATNAEIKSFDELKTHQAQYKNQTGKYLAIINGTELDPRLEGKAADKIGKNLPKGFSVVEYETWDGQVGFDVTYEDEGFKYSVGVEGPQTAERTWKRPKELLHASSTRK